MKRDHHPVQRAVRGPDSSEQFADKTCRDWGYDGVELACWGEPRQRAARPSRSRHYGTRDPRGLSTSAWPRACTTHLSSHLVSRRRSATGSTSGTSASCRPSRSGATATPKASRLRAEERMKDTARAAARARRGDRRRASPGSSIFHMFNGWPPISDDRASTAATTTSLSAGRASSTVFDDAGRALRPRGDARDRSPTTSRPCIARSRPSAVTDVVRNQLRSVALPLAVPRRRWPSSVSSATGHLQRPHQGRASAT